MRHVWAPGKRKSVLDKVHGNTKWTNDQRKLVAAAYLSTGSLKVASETACVPYATVKDWQRLKWWEPLLNEIRKEHGRKLSIKMTKLLDKSLAVIEDRLENGNVQRIRGKEVRVPISLADALKAQDTIFKQQRLLQELPTNINSSSQNDALEGIAQKLRLMGAKDVSGKMIEAEAIQEVEVVDEAEQDLQV